jgi:hypothetical protein
MDLEHFEDEDYFQSGNENGRLQHNSRAELFFKSTHDMSVYKKTYARLHLRPYIMKWFRNDLAECYFFPFSFCFCARLINIRAGKKEKNSFRLILIAQTRYDFEAPTDPIMLLLARAPSTTRKRSAPLHHHGARQARGINVVVHFLAF